MFRIILFRREMTYAELMMKKSAMIFLATGNDQNMEAMPKG